MLPESLKSVSVEGVSSTQLIERYRSYSRSIEAEISQAQSVGLLPSGITSLDVMRELGTDPASIVKRWHT